MPKYKIWWQSSIELEGDPLLDEYVKAIKEHSKKILSPDFEIEIRGVKKGTFSLEYMYFEFLNRNQIINNIIQAEKEGYDGVAIGCFLDPGLHEAREVVDIPIVGMAETSLFFSCMYGRKFSIVTYVPPYTRKRYPQMISAYGLESRAAPMGKMNVAFESLTQAFKNPGPVIDAFLKAAKEVVDQGAEVILSGCGLMNIVLAKNGVSEVKGTGVPILDTTGTLMKVAEAAIILNKVNGLKVSRMGYYEKPSNVSEVRKIYGLE